MLVSGRTVYLRRQSPSGLSGYFETFDGSQDGWLLQTAHAGSPAPTTECGAFGSILGGAGVSGKNAFLEKTYNLTGIAHDHLSISFDFIQIDTWDEEEGRLLVDGEIVWSQIYGGGFFGEIM